MTETPTITLDLPVEALVRLREVWQTGTDENPPLLAAVRDVFDGYDGDLHTIAEALA